MPWFDSLFELPFIEWLRRIAASGRYTQQVPADPFATSMRDLDDVSENLRALAGGTGVTGQRHTDLKAAQLVDQGRLTPLGVAVLRGWIQDGCDNDDYTDELPRQLVLICEALAQSNAFYQGVAKFWEERFRRYGASEVIARWESSYALSFFANAFGGTYSPLKEYELGSTVVPDWNGPALTARVAAAVAPGDTALLGVQRIVGAIDGWASRGKARKLFLMALDMALAPDAAVADPKLDAWTIPLRSGDRAHSAVPAAVKNKCLSILDRYREKLAAGIGTPVHFDLLHKRKNVVFFGPPGTGKTYSANQIAEYWRGKYGDESVVVLTFHPSYSYEDFVWGWRPDGEATAGFSPRPGALLEACARASDGAPVLLLIDEINRADTSRVFGELITYIEADKRDMQFRIAQDATINRTIPSSLHILGTMNTADRSVSLMDVALRRRFAFVEFEPDGDVFSAGESWQFEIQGVSLSDLLHAINRRLEKAGVEPDRAIGHALLAIPRESADPVAELKERFQFDIHPLVVDYCFADRTRVEQVLKPLVTAEGRFKVMDNSQFVNAIREIVGAAQAAIVAPTDEQAVDVASINHAATQQ
ncbi:McrB family protein [Pseudoxanthomonas mexicana]